ncbi:hypothetical protein C8R47DRAFT_1052008 [Mycena vitilis]|nr:hypothetical protein C8R47DRAFT_1052008 [Mycena vitilis]
MPKAKPSTAQGQYIVFTDGRKRVLVPRPKTHKMAVETARRHFPSIPEEDLRFQTDELAICDGKMTEIAAESWNMVDLLSLVAVAERHECPVPVPASGRRLGSGNAGSINLTFLYEGAQVGMKMKTNTRFSKVFSKLQSMFGPDLSVVYEGSRVHSDDTPESLSMEDQDDIYVRKEQFGGKPVIYLSSPAEIGVSVALTLTREWNFSVIYPVVPMKSSTTGQHIQWNVRTHSDGTLTEVNTGLDVAYLFWEAQTNHAIPLSPPASPVATQLITAESFSPLSSDLCPADSVLITVHDITPYLDKVLLGLGLHTEARTSFITYWLPSFLKHTHVALRFVPQAAYESAAVLDIQPVPDVVTRVFMLFKGIPEEALADWAGAGCGANDAEHWRGVVGVDVERASDTALFRVLEWGGMEVLAH